MKRLLLLLMLVNVTLLAGGKNILSGRFTRSELQAILIQKKDWKPFPRIQDRAGWDGLSSAMKRQWIANGEKHLKYQWPSLPASTTLLFVRNGNRSAYEDIYFEKRDVLCALVMAELFENKGRFLDQIGNGIWNICEESSWALPAHFQQGKHPDGLPDVTEPLVDLFSAATGGMLSWIDYFYGERLDAFSPQVRKRLLLEVDRRVLTPALMEPHFWQNVSFNWNTWICSNWLACVLLTEQSQERRTDAVGKILWSLDNFLNPYPADGGCDEGPSYWTAAGESLLETIELLNLATHDRFTVSEDPLLRNIGAFIYKAQLSRGYFLNFSDAPPTMSVPGAMVQLLGKRMKDTLMMEFGSYYTQEDQLNVENTHFTRVPLQLFANVVADRTPKKLPLLRDVWFPDNRIMIARDQAGSDTGFCVAAIAAHNAKAHNHNDVGSFMVYRNNTPVLIDIGSGTYTARTFNQERYTLWFNSSAYHNVPLVHGVAQHEGEQFRATDVVWKADDEQAGLQCEMAHAYPPEAGIQRWQRTVRLNRNVHVAVTDSFVLTGKTEVVEHFMTIFKPDVATPGEIRLDANGQVMVIRYNPDLLVAAFEKKDLTDPEDRAIMQRWGENIYRIQLRSRQPIDSGMFSLEIAERKRSKSGQ